MSPPQAEYNAKLKEDCSKIVELEAALDAAKHRAAEAESALEEARGHLKMREKELARSKEDLKYMEEEMSNSKARWLHGPTSCTTSSVFVCMPLAIAFPVKPFPSKSPAASLTCTPSPSHFPFFPRHRPLAFQDGTHTHRLATFSPSRLCSSALSALERRQRSPWVFDSLQAKTLTVRDPQMHSGSAVEHVRKELSAKVGSSPSAWDPSLSHLPALQPSCPSPG